MGFTAKAAAFVVVISAATTFGQQTPEPVLAKFLDGPRTIVGELVSDSDKTVTIRDLESGKEKSYDKSTLKLFEKGIGDNEAIASVGLTEFMAWKLSKVLPAGKAEGRIIKADGGIIFINLGEKAVKTEQELTVYRGTEELKDPVTGIVLGKERRKIARLEVTEVKELFCKAKLKGDLEIKLDVGDEVEPTQSSNAIAIFPMVDTAGNVTVGGRKLSEELTTKLVPKGVQVVERALLTDAVLELSLQKTFLFDANQTQKVGKQVGAFAILSGTIVPAGKFVEAHLRLIEVDSGKVLLTATARLQDIGKTSPLAVVAADGTVSSPGANNLDEVVKSSVGRLITGKWDIRWADGHRYSGLSFSGDGKWQCGTERPGEVLSGAWLYRNGRIVAYHGKEKSGKREEYYESNGTLHVEHFLASKPNDVNNRGKLSQR